MSDALNHSTQVQVTINAAATPPVALPATTPASGTGGAFSFAASDPGGNGANINWMEVLLNGTLSGSQACYLHYDRTGQVLYLRDDVNPSWVASATLPMAGGTSLANSQCTVTAATGTVTGGTLTLNATLNFTRSFAGAQTIYEIADAGNLNSGWDTVASYTVTTAAGTLPTGWLNSGINGGGTSSYAGGTYAIQNPGGALGGSSDGLQFAYTALTGDGTIVARMTGLGAPLNVSDAGIMLRTGPTPTAAMMFIGIENNAAMVKWRTDTGVAAQSWAPAAGTAGAALGTPYWFRLVRTGSAITASISANGVDWTQMGAPQTLNIAVGSTMYAGLAVSGYHCCATGWANFDNVTVTSAADFYLTALPSVWTASSAGVDTTYAVGVGSTNGFSGTVNLAITGLPSNMAVIVNPGSVSGSGNADLTITTTPGATGSYPFTITAASGALTHSLNAVLNVSAAPGGLPEGWLNSGINGGGSTSYSNGVFGIQNLGGALSGTWDGLQFAYTPMVGDGSITARMTSLGAPLSVSDAGIMLRTGPTPTSGMMFAGIENNAAMVKWRNATGLSDQATAGPAVGIPFWFRLVRTGNVITAYISANGASGPQNWTQAGTPQTITDAGSTMYAGLAVSGYDCCAAGWANFDNVTVIQSNGSGTADFSLAAPTATQMVDAGESTSVPVTVNVTGQFNGPVALTVDPATLPAGMTPSFGPATLNGAGESTLILTAGPSTTGNFTITINGTSGALSHSTQVQVTINGAATPPVALPATTPASGTGGAFSFAGSDPGGNGANISWMEVLVNGALSGTQACYLHYDRTGQVLYLRDDVNPSWVASATMPMAGGTSLANSQCTVTAATGTVTGGTLTLNATLNFTRSFAGAQTIYEIADSGNLNSGWDTVASYTVATAAGTVPTGWLNSGINGGGTSSSWYSNWQLGWGPSTSNRPKSLWPRTSLSAPVPSVQPSTGWTGCCCSTSCEKGSVYHQFGRDDLSVEDVQLE